MTLRATREQSGKTQAQVAKEANISEAQYQNIEYAKSTPSVTPYELINIMKLDNANPILTPSSPSRTTSTCLWTISWAAAMIPRYG